MKFYITGTRRGLGKYLSEIFPTVDSLEDCDVFINCKHDGYQQVDMLYKASQLNKKIINISSNSSDGFKRYLSPYSIEKYALDKANEQLFYNGVDTTCLRFGYIDTERVAEINEPKMPKEYIGEVIYWVISQPHRIKEMTILPRGT